ncbi:MAG TPA: TonB-dependent receptor [Bryobacteraceae bacterium]|jgi:hypothetical protein
MKQIIQFGLAYVLIALLALAQESRGTISGRISDPSGGVVAQAQLTFISESQGTVIKGVSNQDGLFTVPYLLPGFYDVVIVRTGFSKLERKRVEVRVGENTVLDLSLTLGDVSQTVQVTAASPELETGTASLGTVVDRHNISELPIASGNVAELVVLAPGVSNTGSIAIHKAAFNAGTSTLNVDGNSTNANEFTIDGVPNVFASGSVPRIAFSPPPTTISEFKVMTTFYDAAIGHTSGAVFNMNTSSGENRLHGELHEFLQNGVLNANGYFSNLAGQPRTNLPDNRYGGAIGGPIYIPRLYDGRNKTFFFYAYEGDKWDSFSGLNGTVPTDAEKSGNFSSLLALGPQYQIYNPFSTTSLGNGTYRRSPFAGNIIPSSMISPIASKILSYYPEPNAAGAANGTGNYVQPYQNAPEDYFAHFLRVDHSFTERSRFFVRLDYDYWDELQGQYFGVKNISEGDHENRINKGLALDEVYMLSPSTVLDVRYGLTQQSFPDESVSTGFDLSSLGFSSNLTSLIPKNAAEFPFMSFAGFTAINGQATNATNTSLIHSLQGSLATQKGSHYLHYGIDFRVNRANLYTLYGQASPLWSFNSTYTNGPLNTAAAAPLGQDLATLLLGIPQGQMIQNASYADQDVYVAGFLQDDWKLNSKLTINLGLRLEHETPVTERYNRAVQGFAYSSVNPVAAQAIANYTANPMPGLPASAFNVLGGLNFAGGSNGRALWHGQSIEALPRVGLAYRVSRKTVVRAGFGLFYDTLGTYRSPAIQTGFSSTTTVVPSVNNGISYVATLANPFPNGLQAPSGAAAGLATQLGQTLSVYPKYRPLPYAERWSFDIQQALGAGFVLDVSYVGNHGVKLPVVRDVDATPNQYLSTSPTRDQTTINYLSQQFPDPFYGLISSYGSTISRAQLLKPFPEFTDVQENDSNGYSHYNALQIQLSKRLSHGFMVNVAYSFSKLMDATSYLNAADSMPWYGISTYDRPQVLAISEVWELPFGRGRRVGANMPKWADYLAGGWELNTTVTAQSGDALTFGDVLFNGNIKNIPLGSGPSIYNWFNTSGFVTASALQLANNVRTFPLRLAGVRGPGQDVWNIGVDKYFSLTEHVRLQLRGEGYNAFNHANFKDPILTPTSSQFGQITGQNGYAREIQVAARIVF